MSDIKEILSAPRALQLNSIKRTASFTDRLDAAIAQIEKEIEENDGIYPYNKGTVNQSEVCRRAGVRKGSLQGRLHKTTTKVKVDQWVDQVNFKLVKGAKVVRKEVTSRVEDWKIRYNRLATHYNISRLEVGNLQRLLKEQEELNSVLRSQLGVAGESKIVPLKKSGPKLGG